MSEVHEVCCHGVGANRGWLGLHISEREASYESESGVNNDNKVCQRVLVLVYNGLCVRLECRNLLPAIRSGRGGKT